MDLHKEIKELRPYVAFVGDGATRAEKLAVALADRVIELETVLKESCPFPLDKIQILASCHSMDNENYRLIKQQLDHTQPGDWIILLRIR